MAFKPKMSMPKAAPKASAPVAKPASTKRPSGQFAGKRELLGKVNGGGHNDEPSHPQSHEEFEKLGHDE